MTKRCLGVRSVALRQCGVPCLAYMSDSSDPRNAHPRLLGAVRGRGRRSCEITVHRNRCDAVMSVAGHQRRTRSGRGSGACPLRSESDRIAALPRVARD
jgi:hypothetical protein